MEAIFLACGAGGPQLKRNPLGSSTHTMRVNIKTAEAVLLYMLADAGFEPPLISVREGWKVFQQFLAQPAESQTDLSSFQTVWIRENPGAPIYQVTFSRQLSEPDENLGTQTRAIGVQFLFDEAPSTIGEVEVWSNDFRNVDAFVDHVEGLPEFDYCLDATPTEGDVVIDED